MLKKSKLRWLLLLIARTVARQLSAQDEPSWNTIIAFGILLCSGVSLRAQTKVYDSATYGSGLAAKMAFVNAVKAMGSPLGQESFPPSSFPAGTYPFGITLPGGTVALGFFPGADLIVNSGPVSAGNNAEGAESEMGISISGISYIGFDFDLNPLGVWTNRVTQVGIEYDSVTYLEPLSGFFGVVSNQFLNNQGIAVSPIVFGSTSCCVGPLFIDNILYAGGPGTSASNPLFPDSSSCDGLSTGLCIFLGIMETFGAVFDPATTANTYIYQTLHGSHFTSVGGFPSGFSSPFHVSSGGTDYGLFGPGETLTFPGGGVSSFTIGGIKPSVDGSSPTAFPIELSVDTIGADVEATALHTPQPISTTASGLAYSRVSQTFNGALTITNTSASSITGPFQILFMALPTGVTVPNSTGTFFGNPFITVPAVASLSPGQSVTVSVQLKNSSNAAINFTPVVYSGGIN